MGKECITTFLPQCCPTGLILKRWQCPEHPGSEPRPTSTAHLIIVTGLTETLRMDETHLIYKFPAWTTVQNVTNPIRRTAVSDYSYNNKRGAGGESHTSHTDQDYMV